MDDPARPRSKNRLPGDLARQVADDRSNALHAFRTGALDGLSTARKIARVLDRFFGRVLKPWIGPNCGFAVFALGSYGRRDLCLHSDIDGLLLHRGPEPSGPVRALSDAVRALWDAGVRARIAVYSLERARRVIEQDTRVLAAMLDYRPITGDRRVTVDLKRLVATLPDRHVRKLARLLRREDVLRSGDPHLDLFAAEPDVKTAQGGLRDLASVEWFSRWARLRETGSDRRKSVVEPLVSEEDRSSGNPIRLLRRSDIRRALRDARTHRAALADARTTLVTTRLLLDVAGARRDRFTREASLALERLRVRAYVPIEHERRLASARILVFNIATALHSAVLDSPGTSADRPRGRHGGRRDSWMGLSVRQRPASESRVPAQEFLDHLERPGLRRVLLDLLNRGVLYRILPGFQRSLGLVPGDEVHRFTVDRHLVLTASAAADLLDQEDRIAQGDDAVATGRRHRVRLLLAALFHDLGKSGPPPHPDASARLARAAAMKLGLPRLEADRIASLCRFHMVLPDASTTLDCDAPEVVERLARIFEDVEQLDLAFLLGIADMRALGPATATGFREALLCRAWAAVRRHLGGRDFRIAMDAEVARRREMLRAFLGRDSARDAWLEGLIERLPDRVLLSFPPERLHRLTLALQQVRIEGPRVLIEPLFLDQNRATVSATAGPEYEVLYLGFDEVGLLSRLSGGMALEGLTIQEARIFSLPENLVLDQFRVIGLGAQDLLSRAALSELARRLTRAACDPAIASRVQTRAGAFLRSRTGRMDAEVDNASLPDRSIFRVIGPDAPGLLHFLADIFFRHGINVTGAIVTTEGAVARDTFFVEWSAAGGKVLDPEAIRRVLRAISSLCETRNPPRKGRDNPVPN